MMHGSGKSDRPIVPAKPPNEAGALAPTEEGVEGRGLAKGNSRQQNTPRTPCRPGVPSALERVRQAARADRTMRFTALLHHVYDLDHLRKAYLAASREDAARRVRPLCGRAAEEARCGKPETFDFLGFTHICARKRSNGRFTVLRQTIRKRLQAKLGAVKTELKRRMHLPVAVQGAWLRSVVGGHIRYYGVPMNNAALSTFRFQVGWLWMRTLRRGQRHRLTWARMKRHIERWLPPARPCHPYPLKRLGVVT
jgi:hypothetical protein